MGWLIGALAISILIALYYRINYLDALEEKNRLVREAKQREEHKWLEDQRAQCRSIKTIDFKTLERFSHFEDVFLPGEGGEVLDIIDYAMKLSDRLNWKNAIAAADVLAKNGNHPYFCQNRIYFTFPHVSYYSGSKKYGLPKDYSEACNVCRIKWNFRKGNPDYTFDWPQKKV